MAFSGAWALVLPLALFVGFQPTSAAAVEWTVNGTNNAVCMIIKFDGLIRIPDNPNLTKYFQTAEVIDPQPNCTLDKRTVRIGYEGFADLFIELTFTKSTKTFALTQVSAAWYHRTDTGDTSEITRLTGLRSSDNLLPQSVSLGCYYFQEEVSISFDDFIVDMKDVAFQPFAGYANNSYGTEFTDKVCQVPSGVGHVGGDVMRNVVLAFISSTFLLWLRV
ncbi:uncharacterized protein LOC110981614 isoform X2 [Acanthaster planci]|uniref:Uncharacterized protein LOC110981614 isoform X2 n=1 Tax=Acanthaster planci TaxID=133434 RepID=A0A8B7YP20_ACAPL|nr:uncharacterized protein LOC110981614 isoform X2 [Acanthaster planci]